MDAEYQEAREQLSEILSREEYTRGERLERGIRFIDNLLNNLDVPSPSFPSGEVPVWLLSVLLLLFLILFLWWVRKNLAFGRRWKQKREERAVTEPSQSDRELRTLGEAAARRGDFRLAIRCQFQAVLAVLKERGMLSDVSHRTHREQIAELRSRIPQQSALFESLVLRFEEVWYGKVPVGPADYHQFHQQADKLLKGERFHATTG